MDERFPGELDTLRGDNVRLRRLLKLSEERVRAADPDQATLTGAPTAPVDMRSAPEAKLRFYTSLFRCRTDVYALRWENRQPDVGAVLRGSPPPRQFPNSVATHGLPMFSMADKTRRR